MTQNSAPLKTLLINTCLGLFSLFLLTVLCEVGFRIFKEHLIQKIQSVVISESSQTLSPLSQQTNTVEKLRIFLNDSWRLQPNYKLRIMNHTISGKNVTVETNSLGYRNAEVGPKRAGEYRILVLGDSITLADYLEVDNTYPALLETKLRGAGQTDKISVINASVGGIDLASEYAILMESGLSLQPDLVLIGLYLNDASRFFGVRPLPDWLRSSHFMAWIWRKLNEVYFIFRYDQETEDWAKWFLAESGRKNADVETKNFDEEIIKAKSDWGYAWSPAAWRQISEILQAVARLGETHHFKTAVMLFPVRKQVEASLLRDEPQQSLLKVSQQVKIPYLDLLPILRNVTRQEREYLYYDHCHLKTDGYKIVVEALAVFLRREKLIP